MVFETMCGGVESHFFVSLRAPCFEYVCIRACVSMRACVRACVCFCCACLSVCLHGYSSFVWCVCICVGVAVHVAICARVGVLSPIFSFL